MYLKNPRLTVAAIAALVLSALAVAEAMQVFIGLRLMGSAVPWTMAMKLTVPSWSVLLLLVVPLLWWLDGRPSRVTHPRRIAFHMVAGLAFALLHLTGSTLIGEALTPSSLGFRAGLSQLASTYFVLDLLTYVAVVGTHYAIRRDQEDARRDVQAARLMADLSEARLMALEGKLRPDFFFNTLNAVSGLLVRGDSARGVEALSSLGSLVRTTLSGPSRRARLEEEMELVADYLSLQELRFPDRLHASCIVDREAGRAAFPPLLLIQLVEALVDRGLSHGGPFYLKVEAHTNEAGMRVSLDHSAPPLDDDDLLRLARRRLATCDPRGDLVVGSGGELSLQFVETSKGPGRPETLT